MEYNEAGFINVKVNGKYVKNYLCPSSEAIVRWVGPTNAVAKRGKCTCKGAGAHKILS